MQSASLRGRIPVAVLWIAVANALIVWWLTGDIEMGWILALIIVSVASAVIGLLGAVILGGRPLASLEYAFVPLVLSLTLGLLLLVVAIRVAPHLTRTLDPPPALRTAADSLAADRAGLRAEARRITGLPVEIGEPSVALTPGRLFKEGFRLGLTRVEPSATISFTFTAGPARRMVFDVIREDDVWRARPRDPEPFAELREITLTRAYLERRFPGFETVFDDGWPTYARGDTALVLLRRATRRSDMTAARGIADRRVRSTADGTLATTATGAAPDDWRWQFVVFRIGAGKELLEEVRRYSSDEIVRHFDRAAAAAGLGNLRSVRFVRPPNRLHDPSFGFLGELEGGPRRMAWFNAVRVGGEVEFGVATR